MRDCFIGLCIRVARFVDSGRLYGGGVTTLELAKAIDYALDSGTTGLVHLSNGIGISKYDLLCMFEEIWQKQNVEITSCDANGVDKSIKKISPF